MSEYFTDEITVKDIFEEMCAEESEEYAKLHCPFWLCFSFKHRKAMKKILFPSIEEKSPEYRINWSCIPLRKRFMIFLLSIILALFAITAAALSISEFNRKEHLNNTELFIADAENSPKTIEKIYCLSKTPDGYELSEQITDSWGSSISYINKENRTLTFSQSVKEDYDVHFDSEYHTLEEVVVNNHYGLYMDFSDTEHASGIIVWDDGDYIFEIFGDLSKNELLNLAKTLILKK